MADKKPIIKNKSKKSEKLSKSPSTKSPLKKIAKRYSGRVLVSERMANDTQIAMASWGRLDKMTESTFDEDYALRFIKKYTNKSPEKFAK